MVSRSDHLLLPRQLYEAMLQHAQAELPNECCGLLAGVRDGETLRALVCHPLVNQAASPIEYLSEPRSIFQATKEMRNQDHEIVAIYHSHPTSAPIPSRTDLARCYSSEVVHFIIGLEGLHFFYLFPLAKKAYLLAGPKPLTRGWWLTETDVEEAAWEIGDP